MRTILLLFFFIFLSITCNARRQQFSHSSTRYPLNGLSTRKKRLHRTLQSWGIRHKSKPKSRAMSTHRHYVDSTGSILTFSKPTKENIAEWFGPDDESDEIYRSMLRKEFNHESVGMTNPCLHLDDVSSGADDENSLLLRVESGNLKTTRPASRSEDVNRESFSSLKTWWPTLSFNPIKKDEWRVLTYRRRVGEGRECYERVRNAALDWEFQSEDGKLGLKEVPSSSFLQRKRIQRHSKDPSYQSRGAYSVRSTANDNLDEPMAYHRSIGSFRRLVSFSASSFPFLKNIYAVNPVMVIYDLVDQRAPDTTFSSTAYATMKGHLLRGEERVTVALRDRNQAVDVEIISISKAGESIKAKGLWPFIGKMQNKFFESQMKSLEKVAQNNNTKEQNKET